MKIGIGITTHNRNNVANLTIENIKKLAPNNSVIVVVDDNSNLPNIHSDYRFNKNVGIAKAKNKCIELLVKEKCTHFFLFDDDIYPIVENWHLKYIETGINHLCFTFNKYRNGLPSLRKLISINNNICEYETPCGCMIYFTKLCIDIIGGFDEDFKMWGYEHVNFSLRIHNAGLTIKPFMDIKDSHLLFYSYDQHQSIQSSVQTNIRREFGKLNKDLFYANLDSKEYKKYD